MPTQSIFCSECGIEIDTHDVDANMATWGIFKGCCSDCVEYVDNKEGV